MIWQAKVFLVGLGRLQSGLSNVNRWLCGRDLERMEFFPASDGSGAPLIVMLALTRERFNGFFKGDLKSGNGGRRSVPAGSLVAPEGVLGNAEKEIFLSLLRWRRKTAGERGLSESVICLVSDLKAVAFYKPESLLQLSKIRGFGPWRKKSFGPEIIGIVKGFLDSAGEKAVGTGCWPKERHYGGKSGKFRCGVRVTRARRPVSALEKRFLMALYATPEKLAEYGISQGDLVESFAESDGGRK